MGSKSATEMLEFPCPECSTRLKVGASLAGHPVKCPSCGFVGRAPAGENQQTPAAASAVAANPPANLSDMSPPPVTPPQSNEQIAAEVAPEVINNPVQSLESSAPRSVLTRPLVSYIEKSPPKWPRFLWDKTNWSKAHW